MKEKYCCPSANIGSIIESEVTSRNVWRNSLCFHAPGEFILGQDDYLRVQFPSGGTREVIERHIFSEVDMSRPTNMERLLLILDLNGTVLHRSKSSGKITPRPYLRCLLHYCMGSNFEKMNQKHIRKAWNQQGRYPVFREDKPTGSEFWLRENYNWYWSPPATRVHLMIWSSATIESVEKMIEKMTDFTTQRAMFERVWSRGTLVSKFDYFRKAGTTKDLSIVWDELNRWLAFEHKRTSQNDSPSFISRAWAQDRLDRSVRQRKQYYEKSDAPSLALPVLSGEENLYRETILRTTTKKLDSIYGSLLTEPFGPHNTVLLDDSIHKARCQPNNHLCIPEYDKQRASKYSNYLNNTSDKGAAEELDDYLLQLVGVLDFLQNVPDVEQWIQEGGATTFSIDQTPKQRAEWCQRGRETLERLEIPVEP